MHITQLDNLIQDLTYVDLNDPYDQEWLGSRVKMRESHGIKTVAQCDGCPAGEYYVTMVVEDYPDDMGAPNTLGLNYLCNYHLQNF